MAMANTPRRAVHWAFQGSPFSSPFSEGSSTESFSSGSSLQFINDQLVAHGFTHPPGLSLETLANSDSEKVVKCLLAMLSQRIEDMARTEELTTKLRTLSYDHERLRTMHADMKEKAASADREVESYKSRLANANRALQSSEAAHRSTTAELQRTRTSLQTVRATYQAEVKKKEKELERTVEKWMKLSDSQLKLGAVPSSMIIRCANGNVTGTGIVGKGKGFLEVALEQAEKAAKELREENSKLRIMVLGAVNEMQSVLHLAKSLASESNEEPIPVTMTILFPLSPTGAASQKMNSLLNAIRDSLSLLARSTSSAPASLTSSAQTKVASDGDVERLQGVIDGLMAELEQARVQASEHTAKIQEVMDRYAEDERMQGEIADMSMELMTIPLRDEEKEKLENRAKELEEERKKFTEATIRLGKERAALEAEKLKLQEEMRSWQVQQMLSELPPTPGSVAAPPVAAKGKQLPEVISDKENAAIALPPRSPRKGLSRSLSKSQRKSPLKRGLSIAVGKGASAKRTRVSRRSSLGTSPTKLVPAFETELLPPLPAPTFKTSFEPIESDPLLFPSSFVLPPPSPSSTLPPPDPLLMPRLVIPTDREIAMSTESPFTLQSLETQPLLPEPDPPHPGAPIFPPSTPARNPFPVAKPLANRMMHAYSPAKPSPLSRILMLANSPGSPDAGLSPPLGILTEEEETDEPEALRAEPVLTLAQELGVDEEDDSPLREKPPTQNVNSGASNAKGKQKAVPAANNRTRPAAGALEKENNRKRIKGRVAPPAPLVGSKATSTTKASKSVTKPPAPPAAKLALKQGMGRGGGPRRVPIGSAEAAPVGPGWKG
ncbi:hypothetical protein NEOLEDRAFT_1156280 [Neolentinus lepideus HHB14362 ss-1]|uniref:Afadin and alpha-actinin-binding-domain-containing protein n=1 Tax=Neolentinus lepideus HHB14362 ss-1 TaxID=1314782 RepID=A0A165SL36_9AGAM|nr:hypothetical protein NEOLEDRAFT_1156280 [Neolentinus lepideus HHB14362 ss-1]